MSKVTSKWDNYRLLWSHPDIAPYLPTTTLLTPYNLKYMIDRYPSIYLKPDNSCQGKGLFRLDRSAKGIYQLRSRDSQLKTYHTSLQTIWTEILKRKMKRRYIIQRAINSLTLDGKMFDIRTHMMRLKGEWVLVAMVARIGAQGQVATNTYSGGTSHFVEQVFTYKLGLDEVEKERLLRNLIDFSFHVTDVISASYPRWTEYGLDIGIDSSLNLWLYEINIKPGGLVFYNLDKSIYHKLKYLRKYAK